MTDLLAKLYDTPDATVLIRSLNEEEILIRRAMAYEKHLAKNRVLENLGKRWAPEGAIEIPDSTPGVYRDRLME